MKKTISLLLIVMLLVSIMVPTAFAAEHSGTVTVTYTAYGDAFTGFLGNLTYDHDLFTLVSVSGVNCNSAENHNDRVIWERGTNLEAPATVLTAVFSLKAGIPCGDYTGFGVALSDAINENREGVSLSISGSKVSLPHDWVEGTQVDATCTTDGYIPYTCSICGNTKQTTITAPGHVPGTPVIENETGDSCTAAGSFDKVVYCTVCDCELSRDTITGTALGHTAGAAVKENVVAADCVNDGSYDNVVYCSVCGDEISRETVKVPALGHNWVDATCTTPKTCSVCGATEGAALGHNWADATCTTPKTCSVCGVTEGAALGHDYHYEYNETHHWTVCERCGDKTENQLHNFLDKGGDKLECVCGATKDKPSTPTTQPTDPTDPEGGNKTGDITPYPVFFVMAAALIGTAYGFKRKFVK